MAAPQTPRKKTSVERLPMARWARAIRARVPPSPLLSARIRKKTYLTVTTRIRAQNTSETVPSTASSAVPPLREWASASRMA